MEIGSALPPMHSDKRYRWLDVYETRVGKFLVGVKAVASLSIGIWLGVDRYVKLKDWREILAHEKEQLEKQKSLLASQNDRLRTERVVSPHPRGNAGGSACRRKAVKITNYLPIIILRRITTPIIEAAGIREDKRPLVRSANRRTGIPTSNRMSRVDAWRMIERREAGPHRRLNARE